jgi:hypothetical protein
MIHLLTLAASLVTSNIPRDVLVAHRFEFSAAVLATRPNAEEHFVILGDVKSSEKDEMARDAKFAYDTFSKFFQTTPPPITLDLRDTKSPDGAKLYLPWISEAQARKMIEGQVPESYIDQVLDQMKNGRPLSHEIGHILLANYVDSQVKALDETKRKALKNYGFYGSPYLKDWADEAGAILCEQESLSKERLSQAKSADDLVSLKELFTMTHPGMSDEDIVKAKDAVKEAQKSGSGAQVIVKTSADSEMMENSRKTNNFYIQISSLCAFMREKAGDKCVKAIIDGLVQEKSMDEILPTIEGLPKTVDQLEKDWKQWLKK